MSSSIDRQTRLWCNVASGHSSLVVSEMTKEMHIENNRIWIVVKENVVAFGEIGVLWR